MLKTISEIICYLMFGILDFHIIKELLDSEEKLTKTKNIFLLILLVLSSEIVHTSEYSISPVLIRFILNIIIFKLILDESLYKVTVLYILAMMMICIADIMNATIMIDFFSVSEVRTNYKLMMLSNTLTVTITYGLFKVINHSKKLKKAVQNLENNIISTVIISFSVFLLSINIVSNIGNIYKYNESYLMNILIIAIFITILIIFFKDNNKYSELLKDYDKLFNCVQEFEDTIDSMDLSNHEQKNQIAVLRGYIEENDKKRSLDIINDMIKESYKQDSKILAELKNIPKGGIKGLLYYKIIVAKNNKLNICIDISPTIKGQIERLTNEEVKTICRLIGIYLDNAIEASQESRKKMLVIEVYKLNKKINIVFSNTFKNEVNLEQISKKGYTTKGKGHGKGLYLAKKLIIKNDWIEEKNQIINKLYVQRLIINKNNK